MNLFKIIKYQLYLLQLENYELGRYFKLLFKKGFFPSPQQRKNLVWTQKAKALLLMSIGLYFLIIIGLVKSQLNIVYVLIIACILLITYYLLLTTSLLLLSPFDFIAKKIIIAKAKKKILSLRKEIKIIAIAGSYGKTTAKEALGKVLGSKYQAISTPESVNTPVGISRWILKNLNPDTEILILEMGEHYKGDIKDICNIAKPDVAVITGINESHLERMGSLGVVASTILELADNSAQGAKILFNADDEYIGSHAEDLAKKYGLVSFYGFKNSKFSGFKFTKAQFNLEELTWEYEIAAAQLKGKIFLLGEYSLGLVVLLKQVVGYLKSDIDVALALENLKPVEHRLKPIKSSGGILVIDDAYNGNPNGVREAIKVLSKFVKRRKVFITPGLVEMGDASANVHRTIGKELAGVADVVVLIKNSVTPWIMEGIVSVSSRTDAERIRDPEKSSTRILDSYSDPLITSGVSHPKVIWFNSAQEAHAALGKILQPGDVVVFQNDWGDQYV